MPKGKTKDSETRALFREDKTQSGDTIWICTFCGNKRESENVTRMREHLEKCQRYQEWNANRIDLTGNDGLSQSTSVPSATSVPSVASTGSGSRPSQTLIGFVDRTPPELKREADKQLSLALYTKFVPLAFVSSPHFLKFVSLLRASYQVPSEYILGNGLLIDRYNEVQARTDDLIQSAKCVTLLCDGWSNIRRDGIVGFVACAPSPVFLHSVDTKQHRHTGAYIAELMINAVEKVGLHKALFIVTDNASAMKTAWEKLEERFPQITPLGCAAHGVNLLFLDFLKLTSFKSFRAEVKMVAHAFRRKQVRTRCHSF